MFNGGPGGRNGQDAKAKNFGKAIRRMLAEMKPYYALIVVAMLMSIAGSILSVIAPDKLAEITDEISTGLTLDREKVATVATDLMRNPAEASEIDGIVVSSEEKLVFADCSERINYAKNEFWSDPK